MGKRSTDAKPRERGKETRRAGRCFGREVFKTDAYIEHFNPDDEMNPFREIYSQKKSDVLSILGARSDVQLVLDVGGGMGRISVALTKEFNKRSVVADLSVGMLKIARDDGMKAGNLGLVNADAHDLPFADGTFDSVVALDLLCHLENPLRALREFRRVIRERGLLVLDNTNSLPLWALFYPRYLGKNPLTWIRIIGHRGIYPGWERIVRHYRKGAFLSLFRQSGFEVIRSIDYGPRVCPKWHLAVSRKGG